MNIFDLINKIQIEVGDAVSDTLTKTTDISLWELIWGFDTETGEYSWTSIIIMSMLFAAFCVNRLYLYRTLPCNSKSFE